MRAFAGSFSLEHPLQFHFHAAGGVHGFWLFLRGLVARLGSLTLVIFWLVLVCNLKCSSFYVCFGHGAVVSINEARFNLGLHCVRLGL